MINRLELLYRGGSSLLINGARAVVPVAGRLKPRS
jgi:hypothetical protein